MKRSTEQRTVRSFCRRQPKINVRPHYQRGPVWSRPQKQLLVDSIFRDMDIPKIYLHEAVDGVYDEDVVDGQQRLLAIWEFFANEFPLSDESDPVGGEVISKRRFKDLSEDLKDAFEAYELSVVILRQATDEDVEEMFLRLQNGTTLNAAEKRNAMPGNMKQFVRDLATHPFFERCGFTNQRYAFDHVAAQSVAIELNGGITNIKNTDLRKMYEDNKGFDLSGSKARKVRRVLDSLAKAFPEKTPELKKFNAISMYVLFSDLLENFVIKGREEEIGDWFIEFEQWRRQDDEKPVDERDPELVAYQERTSHATDSKDSLEYRHSLLLRHLHQSLPNFVPLDGRRIYTEEQRLAIFRRDNGVCQVRLRCDGKKCEWGHWHADHRIPWSVGGSTTVENGQVTCPDCNLAKQATIPAIA